MKNGTIRVSAVTPGPTYRPVRLSPLRKIPMKSTLRPFVFDPLADSMKPVGWHYGLVPAKWPGRSDLPKAA